MRVLLNISLTISLVLIVSGLRTDPIAILRNAKLNYRRSNAAKELFPEPELSNTQTKAAKPLAATEKVADNLKYYVYTRDFPNDGDLIQPNVASVVRSILQRHKPITFSIHGWLSNKDSAENQVIVSSKLQHEDCSIIVVDWSAVIGETHEDAFAVIPEVGEAIAAFILLLNKHFAVNYNNIHLVGFSMGAQIAGFTGQSVYRQTNSKVQHITGLDPAGAGFSETTSDDEHLSADDAEFVEVIHTNGGQLGYLEPCGHADYYPNGGQVQPNCDINDAGCSHIRAYELVKEMWSVDNDFVSTKCATIELMNLDICKWVNVKMGENLHRAGLYYLETNGIYPYAKGSFVMEFL